MTEKWNRHQIRSRKHILAPFMEGLIYYQSTCPEFRYEDGNVLGYQPHPTHGSAFTLCVLRLNLIKDTLNIVILTHTL